MFVYLVTSVTFEQYRRFCSCSLKPFKCKLFKEVYFINPTEDGIYGFYTQYM